jgi:hypothetical protein
MKIVTPDGSDLWNGLVPNKDCVYVLLGPSETLSEAAGVKLFGRNPWYTLWEITMKNVGAQKGSKCPLHDKIDICTVLAQAKVCNGKFCSWHASW